jgi:hypothetical protein
MNCKLCGACGNKKPAAKKKAAKKTVSKKKK